MGRDSAFSVFLFNGDQLLKGRICSFKRQVLPSKELHLLWKSEEDTKVVRLAPSQNGAKTQLYLYTNRVVPISYFQNTHII